MSLINQGCYCFGLIFWGQAELNDVSHDEFEALLNIINPSWE